MCLENLSQFSSANLIHKHLRSHRSIRKYRNQLVGEEILNRVLETAIRASSSGNMQAFSVIVTSSQKIKEELLESHFNQSMVIDAPLLLTFCADFRRMKKWLEISNAPQNFDNLMSFMIGAIDAILVSQNACIAAEAEGLGVCYMGTTLANCHKIAKILDCPSGVVPVVGFSLGYPDESPVFRDRLPMGSLVHKERYCDPTEEEIKKSYEEREKSGWARYMEHENLRKIVEEHNVHNLAQLYTKVKYTRESHIEYSENIISCLRKQGFLKEISRFLSNFD